ncbi:MAG: hypothetical protein HZB36_04100 [Candidatus Omnitrophica bacterium]|nr:hypothetical protein [Candidatus Omnitrophota bacterium]
MKIVYKKDFLKSFSSYTRQEQELILEADKQIKLFLEAKFEDVPYGVRIKKIGPNTFEARVNDKIRIIWVKTDKVAYFVLIGNHEDVRRYIKHS